MFVLPLRKTQAQDVANQSRAIRYLCSTVVDRNADIYFDTEGAGQDVGRSCVVVTIGNKNIMFDCGMHMGYNDER